MAEFITKDSGERAQFESGMQRDTQDGKPRFELMLPLDVPYEEQMITRLAALYGRGAEKYDERNWEQANSHDEMARMKASAFRHFMQWMCGEKDEDHAAGTIFNIIAFETTEYKVDRGIDGLQPHEVEAVDEIIERRRSQGLVPDLTGLEQAGDLLFEAVQRASAPEPDGSDCEPVLETKTVSEWLEAFDLVPISTDAGDVRVTRGFFEAEVLPTIRTRPMTSLEVARAKGRPY